MAIGSQRFRKASLSHEAIAFVPFLYMRRPQSARPEHLVTKKAKVLWGLEVLTVAFHGREIFAEDTLG